LLPFCMSFEKDVSGYGTGMGPAGGGGGVKHTSGKAAVTLPSPALQAISSSLAYTLQPKEGSALLSAYFALPLRSITKDSGSAVTGYGTCQADRSLSRSVPLQKRLVR
jgi:hypothetical protein